MELILKNFRNHELLKMKFEDVTEITGKNGVGKTSILEAIVFALYGRDFNGGIDTARYIKTGEQSTTVMLKIAGHEIKRVRTQDNTEVYLNGGKVTQSSVDVLFGSITAVLPIINPFVLFSMNDKEKREMVMRILPKEAGVEIFKKRYGEKLADRFEIETIESARRGLKKLQEVLMQNDVILGQLKEQVHLDKLEISQLKKNLLKTPGKHVESGERDEVLKELAKVQQKLDDLGNVKLVKARATDELERVIVKAKEIIGRYGGTNLLGLITDYEVKVRDNNKRLEELRGMVGENTYRLDIMENMVSSNVCGVCGSEIDIDKFKEEMVELKEGVKTAREEINKILSENGEFEGKLTEFITLKGRGEKAQQDLVVVKRQLEEQKELWEKEGELEEKLGKLVVTELEVLHAESSAKIKLLEERVQRAEETITQKEEHTQKILPQIEDQKVLVEALGPKGVSAEIMKHQGKELGKRISNYLSDFKISTVRENKSNDNVKEVFDVYNGKEIELKSFSFGEKLMANVALALVLREYLKDFKLDFILIDEATILAQIPTRQLQTWCKRAKIKLIYTKLSNGGFKFTTGKHGKLLGK